MSELRSGPRSRSRSRSRLRQRSAVAAAVLLVALVAGGCGAFEDEPTSATTVPNGERLVDLEPGTCFQRPANTDARTVEQVGCRKPHDAEAYAVFSLPFPADEPFPGGSAVQSLAQQGCQERFADYVGQAYEDSQYYFSAIAPSRKSWEDRNDRRVLCSVIAADGGQLEGSVRSDSEE